MAESRMRDSSPSPISKRMKTSTPEVCKTIQLEEKSYHILVKVCAFKKSTKETERTPPACSHNWQKVLPTYMRDNGECFFVCQDCGYTSA